MKNLHTRVFLFILVLLVGSLVALWKLPMRFGLDIKGGMRVVLRAQTELLPKGTPFGSTELEATKHVIENRVNALGVAEAQVYSQPDKNRIVAELPGLKNQDEALEVIKSTARLEFRGIEELDNGTWSTRDAGTTASGADPGYEEIISASTGRAITAEELQEKVFSKPPFLDGGKLKPNSRADIGTGKPIIHFEFKDDAKGIFEDYTRTHINKPLAIFLDNKLLSAPNIRDVIPGQGIIEGNFTTKSAKMLADRLNAGALPVPLAIDQMTKIEPTLGKSAVDQSVIAGLVAMVAVILVMLVWYRVPGLLATIALFLYTVFSLAVFKLVPDFTLTVPGIAGFILSVGMAVDANILIFERMKEERTSGKSIRSSIETGFKRAFSAIADSNICTLITCFILYIMGTGQVKGFALTLAIGVAVSMFTAITCSRTFLLLLAGTQKGQNDGIYALHGGIHPKLNVTKRMVFWFALSGIILVPGMIAWSMGGIKKSIEFTGGTEITATFTQAPTASRIQAALSAAGHRESRVIIAEGNMAYITTTGVSSDAERQKVEAAIVGLGSRIDAVSTVSGAISKELTQNAILAVLYASALIVLYLALRFSIPNFVEGLKFGLSAVIALIHDVGVVWGAFAIFGLAMNWQIDSLFVTAMLTVIGFSVHDSVIIFDRIRENLRHKQRGESFADVADRSIEQTFTRSVRTSGTVVLTLIAMLALGGPTVRLFVTALLIGIVSGTYSSIFNATPILVLLKRLSPDAAPALAGGAAGRGTAARPAGKPAVRPAAQSAPKPDGAAGSGSATQFGTDEDGLEQQTKIQARKRKRRM